jgi:hypothetical protein
VFYTIDLIAGLFLAASPWIFGFSDLVFWPHLIVGILEILVSIMTDPEPKFIGKATDLESI